MDLKRALRIAVTVLAVAALSALSSGQSAGNTYNPAARQAPAKPRDGFIDFTLKRINPADQDYGKCLDEGRVRLLDESLKSGYFWSNLVALGLLGCLFAIIVYQHKIQTRRDWTAAEMLGQCEHALSGSTARLDEVTRENRGLIEDLAALREAALRSAPPAQDSPDGPAPAPIKPRALSARVATPAPKASVAKVTAERDTATAARTATAVEPEPQMALFKPDAALIMRVNTLEQQLARSDEQRKELSRQLNEAGRKLQAEQEKNRALKGA